MRLTLSQQDIYFEQLLYPGEPIYNIGAKIAISGDIVYDVLSQAYVMLINQHDAFRSILVHDGEEVHIETLPEHRTALDLMDFSKERFPEEEANAYMKACFGQSFDLDGGQPLHQFILVKVDDRFYYLFSMYHHIITDGWGTSLMFQRLVRNYNELIHAGRVETQYPFTYRDFVEDDLQYQQSAAFEEDKRYWKDKFRHLPEALFQKLNSNLSINKSSRKRLTVARSLYERLETLATSLNSSTFHVILGVLYLYFGRKQHDTDITIGLPVLNRGKAVFKKTVGLFMGISPLRIQFSYADSFEDLINKIKYQLRQDYRHQRFPMGKLVQELDAFGNREQLFNITLSYEKHNYADHFEGTFTDVIPMTHGAERVALAIYIREFDKSRDVNIDFDYHLNYFDESSIAHVVAHFEQLLGQICDHPQRQLSSFDYLTPAEKAQIIHRFNDTVSAYPREQTFLTYFQDQVQLREDAPAVSDDREILTYRQLDDLSDRIAAYISGLFQDGQALPIAVLMPRSARLVAVLLGVLKSGHPFIPLDPYFPADRIGYILEHSKARCILGTDVYKDLAAPQPPLDSHTPLVPPSPPKATDLAYIIYTSGSTGNPKGVAIGHRSLLNFLLSMQHKPGLKEDDMLFSVTTQSFDISILEFFGPLISGGHVYVADRELVLDPPAVIARLKEVGSTIIQATPGFYQMLFDAGWEGDKGLKVWVGGDLLSVSLAGTLLAGTAELWNMYGPTETTIWSGTKRIQAAEQAANIGRPIRNTRFYILDQCLQPLPVGSAGMLYIGGDGLAMGYYRDEGLTADRFIPDPFNVGERIYNTGDWGRWNERGEVEFLGRHDQQVKIRGYRVELGETEARIAELPLIRSAVVIAKREKEQEAFLVAYVIPEEEMIDPSVIITALRTQLPEYMIPQIIIPVDQYPLTPNKKVDRKALVARDIRPAAPQTDTLLPETDLEISLGRLFNAVLGVGGDIGKKISFFSLGGHSLNAMKLVNEIGKQLHCRISLKAIFDHPTIEALALHISKQENAITPANRSSASEATAPMPPITHIPDQDHYPVSPSQYAMWLAAQGGSHMSAAYNVFVAYEVTGQIDRLRLEWAFMDLIGKYEALRANFIEIQGMLYQRITAMEHLRFQIDNPTVTIQEYVHREFDLQHDLLLRAGIFSNAEEGRHWLAFASHHIVLDGWSVELLIKEIIQDYRQEAIIKPAINFQFRDYVAWLLQRTEATAHANEQFWGTYLQDYPWRASEVAADHRADEYNFIWEGSFWGSLRSAAEAQGATVHTFLLTAFVILLHKTDGQDDLCIGTVNAGRTIADLHDQIGMFVKTLPLRVRIGPDLQVIQLMQMVHNDLLEMDAHQDLPARMGNQIRLDNLFVFQPLSFNYAMLELEPGLALRSIPLAQRFSRFPLWINFHEQQEGVGCMITYDTGIHTEDGIEIMVMKYKKLLEQIIELPEISISQLSTLLTFDDQRSIDIEFNF